MLSVALRFETALDETNVTSSIVEDCVARVDCKLAIHVSTVLEKVVAKIMIHLRRSVSPTYWLCLASCNT